METDEMQKWMHRLTKADAVKQPELKHMLLMLFDGYMDLAAKYETAMKQVEFSAKEAAMHRRHSDWALATVRELLDKAGQKNPLLSEDEDHALSGDF